MNLQTLRCRFGDGHDWTREASRGKPPHFCPEHTRYGNSPQGKGQGTPENAPQEKDEPRPENREDSKVPQWHYRQEELNNALAAGVHALLFGPAGSGKTTSAFIAGEALNRPVYVESCSPGMTPWDLQGFVGATGTYVPGVFREPVEFGGIVLLDEGDNASPETMVSINAIAAFKPGQPVRFKDATVPLHPDFGLMLGANTKGNGQSEHYIRQQLDLATKTRFAKIDWGYDEKLEMTFSPNTDWTAHVHLIRSLCREAGICEEYASPRAVEQGAALLATPFYAEKRKLVEDMVIYNAMEDDEAATVRALLRKHAANAKASV